MKRGIFLVLVLIFVAGFYSKAHTGEAHFNITEFEFNDDIRKIIVARRGLEKVVSFMTSRPDLFSVETAKPVLNSSQRKEVESVWQTYLEYVMALDALGSKYNNLYKSGGYLKSSNRHAEKAFGTGDKAAAFIMSYAAFLAQYRYSLEFIEEAEKNPAMHLILNESIEDYGIPEKTYSKIKYRFLNVIRGAEFVLLNTAYSVYGKGKDLPIMKGIEDDKARIWQAGKGEGPKQTAKNAVKIIEDSLMTAWFPAQKGVSEWMGDVKVLRHDKNLISEEQINEAREQLKPGDILLERREWYLSNLGLPGFWTHAAIYIGTPEERQTFFDSAEVMEWIIKQGSDAKGFEELLQVRYPEAYRNSLQKQEEGHLVRIIEAIGEGVSFTSLEHSAGADSVVVLRPRVNIIKKAQALAAAFGYSGWPYDFDFNFVTDDALVCTELVYKVYEDRGNEKGLRLPVLDLMGRKVTPANEIAKLFDTEFGTDSQQLDFILFLDGFEQDKKAYFSSVEEFRKSWRRPNWHIIVQGEHDKGE